MISLQKRKPGLNKDQRLLTLHDFTPPIILYAQLKVYKLRLKIKLWALLKAWSPRVSFFLVSFSSFSLLILLQAKIIGAWGSSATTYLPGLLRPTPEGTQGVISSFLSHLNTNLKQQTLKPLGVTAVKQCYSSVLQLSFI